MTDLIYRILAWHQSRDRGATAVEYALIIGAIAVVIATLVGLLGGQVNAMFQRTCTAFNGQPC